MGKKAQVVIVGTGHAGVQAADSLRAEGFTGHVTLISDESHLPYQRPPLSKELLSAEEPPLPLRGRESYSGQGLDLRLSQHAVRIERAKRRIILANDEPIEYDELILATGSRSRQPPIEGYALNGVYSLRTYDHAVSLTQALRRNGSAIVVGAGFIGLEFAAAARSRGWKVTVFDPAETALGRAVSAPTARHIVEHHEREGTEFRFGESIAEVIGTDGFVSAVRSTAGASHPADLVLIAAGGIPRTDLADHAGLETNDGIVVDGCLRTSDPHIYAIGDCSRFPSDSAGLSRRLESVQNATDQARHVAKVIMGATENYEVLPWFWSHQGQIKLQIAGLASIGDEAVTVRGPRPDQVASYRFRNGLLSAVETVNMPGVHVKMRKRLTTGPDFRASDLAEGQ